MPNCLCVLSVSYISLFTFVCVLGECKEWGIVKLYSNKGIERLDFITIVCCSTFNHLGDMTFPEDPNQSGLAVSVHFAPLMWLAAHEPAPVGLVCVCV